MSEAITPIKMPKWGLSMQEGTILVWSKAVGDTVAEGEPLVDVETSKITNVFEAPTSGVLRRQIGEIGDTLPVGALIAVIAPSSVSEAEIDAFVARVQAEIAAAPKATDASGLDLKIIEAEGMQIQVGIAGQGRPGLPVVLIHGFGGSLENWTLVMAALAEDRPVYALDLPGHGGSQKTIPDPSVAALARTVVASLDQLDLASAHLVGHSLGGAVAMAAALMRPERVATLSLVASAGLPGANLNAEFLESFATASRNRDLQRVAQTLFADKARASKDFVEALARFKRIDGVDDALAKLKDAMLGSGELQALGNRAHEIKGPVLVITADQDEVVSEPAPLPNAKNVRIEGAGHLPQIERADAVIAALRSHLQD